MEQQLAQGEVEEALPRVQLREVLKTIADWPAIKKTGITRREINSTHLYMSDSPPPRGERFKGTIYFDELPERARNFLQVAKKLNQAMLYPEALNMF